MRSVAATVLGILAVALITLTSIAVWARATVFDGSRFTEVVMATLEEDDVTDALAQTVTDQVLLLVDLEQRVTDLLPGDRDGIAGIVTGAAASELESRLADLLDEPRTQELVRRLVAEVHDRVLVLLRGGGLREGWTVEDGAVTVNLLPLVGRGLEQLQAIGLLDDVVVPEMTAGGDPDEQAEALSTALDRDLPAGFGQVVVYRSDALAEAEASVREAQRLLALAAQAFTALLVGSVVAAAGAVAVARDRWAAVLRIGLGVVGVLVVLRSAVRLLLEQAPDLAAKPGAQAAIRAALTEGTTGLLELTAAIQMVAAVVVLAALWRRGWQRADLVAVAAVTAAAASLILVGLGAGGLLTALAVGGTVAVLGRVLLGRTAPPAAA